jgi:plasmid stabilization system protein ParE
MAAERVEFHVQAEFELDAAQAWYAQRSLIAATAFSAEFIRAMETVAAPPERWPRYLAGTRRYVLPRFPFSVVYRVFDDRLVVVAVTHHRRKPDYWVRRNGP